MRPPSAHPSPLGVIPHFPQQDARQPFGAAVRANPGLLNAPLLVADPHCAHAPTSMGVRNGEILTVEPRAVFRLDADRKRASHFDPLGHHHLHSLEVVQAVIGPERRRQLHVGSTANESVRIAREPYVTAGSRAAEVQAHDDEFGGGMASARPKRRSFNPSLARSYGVSQATIGRLAASSPFGASAVCAWGGSITSS